MEDATAGAGRGAKGKQGIQQPVGAGRLLGPQPLSAEVGNDRIRVHYRNRFQQPVRGKHPLERISVLAGKSPGLEGMPRRDKQLAETVFLDALLPLLDDSRSLWKLTDSMLRCDLPASRRAHQALIVRVPQQRHDPPRELFPQPKTQRSTRTKKSHSFTSQFTF